MKPTNALKKAIPESDSDNQSMKVLSRRTGTFKMIAVTAIYDAMANRKGPLHITLYEKLLMCLRKISSSLVDAWYIKAELNKL
mmetsp:Transcript_38858/g.57342  ORF Transcript_38858/g.57342 Transcript_38858/m.57342 type:complete len:83 (-) Transcript_38858:223-471(-)